MGVVAGDHGGGGGIGDGGGGEMGTGGGATGRWGSGSPIVHVVVTSSPLLPQLVPYAQVGGSGGGDEGGSDGGAEGGGGEGGGGLGGGGCGAPSPMPSPYLGIPGGAAGKEKAP